LKDEFVSAFILTQTTVKENGVQKNIFAWIILKYRASISSPLAASIKMISSSISVYLSYSFKVQLKIMCLYSTLYLNYGRYSQKVEHWKSHSLYYVLQVCKHQYPSWYLCCSHLIMGAK